LRVASRHGLTARQGFHGTDQRPGRLPHAAGDATGDLTPHIAPHGLATRRRREHATGFVTDVDGLATEG